MREKKVNVGAHLVARAEARALAEHAIALGKQTKPTNRDRDVGQQIAFLVMGALAVELYFKAFMIAARGGRVTRGHDLAVLYAEFPPFLKASFEAEYAELTSKESAEYTISAFRFSAETPPGPSEGCPPYRFVTFAEAVDSMARAFVTFRYLFEDLGQDKWTYLPFPIQFVGATLQALERTYTKLEKNEFAGKTG